MFIYAISKGHLYHHRGQIFDAKVQLLPATLWYKRGNTPE